MKSPVNSSAILVGIVRNCEKTILDELVFFREILNKFKQLEIYLVESDSTDASLSILGRAKQKFTNFNYTSLGNLENRFEIRTERLAYCRNTYLEYIQSRKGFFDYVIVADMDNVNKKLSKCSFYSSFEDAPNWDCCTANQSKLYYDLYALRSESLLIGDVWLEAIKLSNILSNYYSHHIYPFSRMLKIDENIGFIEVASAFGGLAIYKAESIQDMRYSFKDNQGNINCEHVFMHSQMRLKGKKIFINSKMINADWTEHTSKFKLVYFIYYTKVGRLLSKVFSMI